MKSALGILWKPWWSGVQGSLAAMESLVAGPRGGWTVLALLLVSAMASWWVYVPIHELLHALGCAATGGTVEELEIQVLYGGAILEQIFPFVRAGGPYAGRLTGFDTGGSDLVYLATDAAPYVLTVLGGFWLLRLSRTRRNPLLFGPAIVLLAAPLISLTGDYYEMGSILVSKVLALAGAPLERSLSLRHDDLFKLAAEFAGRFPSRRVLWAAAVAASAVAGYVLASLTLASSQAWDRWMDRRASGASVAWFLPIFSTFSSLAARVYYRLTVAGKPIPAQGALLLVANHPNGLFDPLLVAAAARRPVRFLAKAPLFSHSQIGWLTRASGSIPVYRRMDDPAVTDRNVEMFGAVFDELRKGAAVGVFPEGVSHNQPSMEPLRTGAARIALGTVDTQRQAFPIIPIGLVLRSKTTFRSEALVVVGSPVRWEDLASRGVEDRDIVRDLTGRIEAGLHSVTVNLEAWEDRALVECAEAIWTAEHGGAPDPVAGVARIQAATRILGSLRRSGTESEAAAIRDLEAHYLRLRRLGLQPADLVRDVGLASGVRWAVRRLHLVALPASLLAVSGYLLFRFPYWLTGRLAHISRPNRDQVATHRLLGGIVVYVAWTLLLAAACGWTWGLGAAAAASFLIPAVGLVGLWIRERWRNAWSDIRSFFLLRSRRELILALQERQGRLAQKLQEIYEAHGEGRVNR